MIFSSLLAEQDGSTRFRTFVLRIASGSDNTAAIFVWVSDGMSDTQQLDRRRSEDFNEFQHSSPISDFVIKTFFLRISKKWVKFLS